MRIAKARNETVISGKPPPERRQPDAEVLPWDDAVDHHGEGEEEEGERRLLATCHRCVARRAGAARRVLGPELGLVGGLLVVDE